MVSLVVGIGVPCCGTKGTIPAVVSLIKGHQHPIFTMLESHEQGPFINLPRGYRKVIVYTKPITKLHGNLYCIY